MGALSRLAARRSPHHSCLRQRSLGKDLVQEEALSSRPRIGIVVDDLHVNTL